jgi:hypothetical protein
MFVPAESVTQRHMVVIEEVNQLAEFQLPGE